MSRNVKILLAILVILGVIIFIIFRELSLAPEPDIDVEDRVREYRKVELDEEGEVIDVDDERLVRENHFKCEDGKHLYAEFLDDAIEIELSEGREMTLSRTESPSGARYANEDESIILFHRSDSIFINEDGNVTFDNCRLEE